MARVIIGLVASKSGNKSIVVTTTHAKMHPIYKKRYTRTSRVMAHDEANEAVVGDRVEIVEIRPLSAQKRFRLNKILAKAGERFKDEDAMAGVSEETLGVHEKPAKETEATSEDKK